MDNMPPDNANPPYIRGTQSYEGADAREAVWYRVVRRRVAQYPQLGIFAPHPPVHPDGSRWDYTDAEMHTVWHVQLLRFNGLEKDTDTTLSRQNVGDCNETIWPIMLDPSVGSNTVTNVNNRFTLNGLAYRDGKVKYWAESAATQSRGPTGMKPAQGFKNPNPIEQVIAYSQARVYNRYSWDTFTQHWKVKLMHLGNTASSEVPQENRWDWMKAEIHKSIPGGLDDRLTPDRLQPVIDLLDAYDPTFVEEVTH